MKQRNRVKAALAEGRVAIGYNLAFPSVHVIEILAPFDFDYVWFDGEHGPFGLEQIEHLCRAAEAAGITPIARVPSIESASVLQYLDRGIQGILGPHIACRADAEQLVSACLFGPAGRRSFGGNRGCEYDFELGDKAAYYQRCNDNMLVAALLEDEGVIENLDEILSVPGIDYFCIGPNDFAQGLGFPGGADRPEVIQAMDEVHTRIRAAGRQVRSDVTRSIEVKQMLTGAAREFFQSHA